MDEKILDDEEAEEFGFKRRIRPVTDGDAEDYGYSVKEAESDEPDGQSQEVPEEELQASLDAGYTFDGYADMENVPLDFSEATEDDESLVMMSPEEAAATVRKREEKARKDREKFEKLVKKGNLALDKGNYEKAREYFTQANEFNSDDLDLNIGYMRAYSDDFSAEAIMAMEDFDSVEEAYTQCYESAGDAFAKQLRTEAGERIKAAADTISAQEKEKSEAYAIVQEERRQTFSERSNRVNGRLMKMGLPFAVFLLAAVLCACFINAISGNILLILTIVFGVLAVGFLIPTLLAAKQSIDVSRLLRENEDLDSTAEGREILRLREEVDFLEKILEE